VRWQNGHALSPHQSPFCLSARSFPSYLFPATRFPSNAFGVGCTAWLGFYGTRSRDAELSPLFLDLNLPHHSDVSMCELGVCYRHFAMQHVMPWHELLSQLHHSPDVMTVERTAQGFRRGGTVLVRFAPALQVVHSAAVAEAVDVHLVHGGTGSFDSDGLDAFT